MSVVTREIRLQELPEDGFAFGCLELADIIGNKVSGSRGYYERFDWKSNLKQLAMHTYLQAPVTNNIQHFLLRGSVGSGKSTAAIAFHYETLDNYAGAKILVMRRTYAELMASTFDSIRRFNQDYGIEAHYRESKPSPTITYKNGSKWVFWASESVTRMSSSDIAHGLKSTEYSGAILEEADMIHLAAVDTVPQRLREKSGVPVRVIFYIANPPNEDHWLCKRFKFGEVAKEARFDYNEMHFVMEDNRKNLVPGYIENQHALYRNKPSLYRRMILGEYGREVKGEPIYGPYFNRGIHVAQQSFIENWRQRQLWKDGPVCLCLDFGFCHPALVVFQDVKIGTFRQIRVLAAFLGSNITLRVWMRLLLDELTVLLPHAEFETYGDPAGEQSDPRGVTSENAFDVLRSLGLNPRGKPSSETGGVDLIIDLLKTVSNHTVLGMQPDVIIEPGEKYTRDFIDMLEIGFTQDPASPGRFKPVDDNYYIHIADAFRYGVVNRRSLRRSSQSGSLAGVDSRVLRPYRSLDDYQTENPYAPEPMSAEFEELLGAEVYAEPSAHYNFGR